MHDPAYHEAVQESRRLGGIRKRREVAIQGAYDLEGIASVEEIRRLVDIAIVDILGLDTSPARCRLMLQAAQVATKLLEVGEFEERIAALEAAKHQHESHRSLFDLDAEDPFPLPGEDL